MRRPGSRNELILAITIATAIHAPFARADITAGPSADPSAAPPPAIRAGAIGPTRVETLPNGLRVIVSPQADTTRAAVMVSYDVGQHDQPEGYAGLPHLVEHAMFAGSRHVPRGQFFAYLERVGATYVNAATKIDSTEYLEVIPAEQLPLALWLESDRMAFMPDVFDNTSLEQVRRTVANEYLERFGNRVAGLGTRLLFQSIFPVTHPYHSVLDDESDIGAISLSNVQWFWQRYYGPERATIVIAGNVDPDVALDLVRRYFGPIVAHGPRPQHVAPELPIVERPRRVVIEVPSIRGPVDVEWITPRALQPEDAALDVLGLALYDAPVVGLRARLVTDGAIASRVHVQQNSLRDASVFEIEAIPRPGSRIATVLPVIEAAVESARRGQLSHDVIAGARAQYLSDQRSGWQDPVTRASRMAYYDRTVGTPDWHDNDFHRYEAVDDDMVRSVAQTWLSSQREITETISPEGRAPIAGRLGSLSRPVRRSEGAL